MLEAVAAPPTAIHRNLKLAQQEVAKRKPPRPHAAEKESYKALAERAVAEYKKQRYEQAVPLYARCGAAALVAGNTNYAASCYSDQANCLRRLKRFEHESHRGRRCEPSRLERTRLGAVPPQAVRGDGGELPEGA